MCLVGRLDHRTWHPRWPFLCVCRKTHKATKPTKWCIHISKLHLVLGKTMRRSIKKVMHIHTWYNVPLCTPRPYMLVGLFANNSFQGFNILLRWQRRIQPSARLRVAGSRCLPAFAVDVVLQGEYPGAPPPKPAQKLLRARERCAGACTAKGGNATKQAPTLLQSVTCERAWVLG